MKSRMLRNLVGLLAILVFAIAGCEGDDNDEGVGKTRFLFNLDSDARFFETPFPTDIRLDADGTIRISDFPNPLGMDLVDRYIRLGEEEVNGWGTDAGIFFAFNRALNSDGLPQDASESLDPEASVFLINVDSGSPGYGERHPVRVVFKPDHGIYTVDNLLCILPVQGVPMRPGTIYAAVVTDGIVDASGKDLRIPEHFRVLREGGIPNAPLGAEAYRVYQPLWEALDEVGIDRDGIAAATVFTTQETTGRMEALRDSVYAMMPFEALSGSLFVVHEYEEFYFVEGRFTIPIFQSGEPPYLFEGGRIFFDANGVPILQYMQDVRFALAVPKGSMPAEGWPFVIHSHGSGGSYRTFINSGLALWLARRGIASTSMDAPHHGERNPLFDSGDLESLLFYNILNPHAFRDNTRQAALEQMVLQNMIGNLSIDQGMVPESDASESDTGEVRMDIANAMFLGHSQGSTVGPLFVGLDPVVRAAVFSGAGGSILWTALTKTSPTDVKLILSMAIGVDYDSEELDEFHPLLSILQIMAESVDPVNYGRIFHAWGLDGVPSKHVFQIVGVTDTYVSPVTQHAMLAASGLDLIAPVLDEDALYRSQFTGGMETEAPVEGNRTSWAGEPITAAAIQFPDPGGDTDGHFVTYNFEEAQYMLSCFFRSAVDFEVPVIPAPMDDRDAPCIFE